MVGVWVQYSAMNKVSHRLPGKDNEGGGQGQTTRVFFIEREQATEEKKTRTTIGADSAVGPQSMSKEEKNDAVTVLSVTETNKQDQEHHLQRSLRPMKIYSEVRARGGWEERRVEAVGDISCVQ